MTDETKKKTPTQHSAGPATTADDKDNAERKMDPQPQNSKNMPGPAGTFDEAGLPIELQGHLGRHLRTVYRELVETPVPDKFLKLLEKLEKSERTPEGGR